ncbi:hypothetical protein ABH940_003495 [Streptacidiphilus sp. BW17]
MLVYPSGLDLSASALRLLQRELAARRRYHRRLLRVFYLSAQVAARCCPTSQAFYQRKRAEGKTHKQAVLALARRRLDVLWALIRDQRTFTTEPPQPHHAVA